MDNPSKKCVISGSTSGIGLGVAKYCASLGYDVMLNGRETEPSKIKELIAAIKNNQNIKVGYTEADISTPEGCEKLIKDTVSTLGGIDVLINNAGIQYVASVEEFGVENWQRVINTNLSSTFYTISKALPYMRKNNWGRIINIASVHGLVASNQKVAYVAAKHGIIGITKTVALETAGSGITCNAVCPGWVLTPLVQKQIEAIAKQDNISIEQAKQKLLFEKQPSREFVAIEDVAAMVAHLITPQAAQITGSSIVLDGGWTAR